MLLFVIRCILELNSIKAFQTSLFVFNIKALTVITSNFMTVSRKKSEKTLF